MPIDRPSLLDDDGDVSTTMMILIMVSGDDNEEEEEDISGSGQSLSLLSPASCFIDLQSILSVYPFRISVLFNPFSI